MLKCRLSIPLFSSYLVIPVVKSYFVFIKLCLFWLLFIIYFLKFSRYFFKVFFSSELPNPESVRCGKGPWDRYSNTLPRANLHFQPNSLTLSSLSKPSSPSSPPNLKTSPPSSPPHSKPSTTPDLLKFHGRTEVSN